VNLRGGNFFSLDMCFPLPHARLFFASPDAARSAMQHHTRNNALTRNQVRGDIRMESRALGREESLQWTLRDLVSPLFRHGRVLLSTFTCAFAVIASLGFLQLHRYQSTMTLAFGPVRPANMTGSERQNTISLSGDEVQSLAALFKSKELLEKVVVANGLERVRGGFSLRRGTQDDAVARAARSLAGEIQIQIHKNNLVKLSYSSQDPVLSFNVLNSLSHFYIAQYASVHSASSTPGRNSPVTADLVLSGAASIPSKVPFAKNNAQPVQTQSKSAASTGKSGTPALEDESKAEERGYLQYLSQPDPRQTLTDRPEMTAISVVVPPAISVLPAHSTGSILFLAFILGFVATCMAGYLLQSFDPFFHSPADVIDVLGIPVVEAVPKKTA
jgi:uncharacterized protein involved in exopolysaccharide biosynthesis